MRFKISNRQILSAAIIVFYLIPLLFFSAYSIHLMSHNKSWALLSLGLLLVVFGTLSLIFLLAYWEQTMREKKETPPLFLATRPEIYFSNDKDNKVTSLDPSLIFGQTSSNVLNDHTGGPSGGAQEFNLVQTTLQNTRKQYEELATLFEIKSKELNQFEDENKQLQLRGEKIAQDFSDYKLFSEEQLKQKQLQFSAIQQIVEEQRTEMEKRQEQIHQLDTKIHDLSYEIKTLLYLHEDETVAVKNPKIIKEEIFHPSAHPIQWESHSQNREALLENSTTQTTDCYLLGGAIKSPGEATLLLKKCINIAQKLTGANYYSNETSRYREFSSSYFAIDQRRLFDSLRSEVGALIVVYSQKEQKLVFANSESKTLLGWSPEKFLSDFSATLQEGTQDWKKALQSLSSTPESQARLLAKTKNGQEIFLNCHLGVIPSGLFRNYAIGVLYPAT